MEETLNRIKKLLLTPDDALREVKTEEWSAMEAAKNYVAIVAAIPALAALIGLIGRGGFFRVLIFAALMYVMGFVNVYVLAKIMDLLAPYFGSTQTETGSFKLSAYAFTPAFVAGVLNVNPSLSTLGTLVSLYGIYILYLGLPVLMGTPENKRVLYTLACIVAVAIVSVIMWTVIGGLAWGSGYNPWHRY